MKEVIRKETSYRLEGFTKKRRYSPRQKICLNLTSEFPSHAKRELKTKVKQYDIEEYQLIRIDRRETIIDEG